MTAWFFVPLIAAIAAALGSRVLQRRFHPVLGTWLLTGLAVTSAVTVFGSGSLLSLTYLSSVGWVADRVGWCRTIAAAKHVPSALIGLTATTLTLCGGVRAWGVLRHYRRTARGPWSEPIVILESAAVLAYTVPGRPGHIVVSTAMLEALDADQQAVMFAHESAHLRFRHHRFVLAGAIAAATVPGLRALQRQIVFSTERWADEEAAAQVGNRQLTARAIAAAAFAASSPAFTLGLADLGVVGRVDALLRNRTSTRAEQGIIGAAEGGLIFVGLGGGIVQIHHLASLVLHICGG